MAKSGGWMIRYILVIVVALILGAAIGELSLFQKTTLGSAKLTAANLVRFLGYGSALVLLWLLAQRAALELQSHSDWKKPASFFVLPLATVIIVPAAHQTLLLVLGSLFGPDLRKIYDWVFILGTISAAIWLAVAMFQHLEALVDAMRGESADNKT
jgi:hypothetical protein